VPRGRVVGLGKRLHLFWWIVHAQDGHSGPGSGFDTTVALTHLGNVRRRAGDTDGAENLFTQVRRRCSEAGCKDNCSEQRSDEVVNVIDKSSLTPAARRR
jgi:hypothetical protein